MLIRTDLKPALRHESNYNLYPQSKLQHNSTSKLYLQFNKKLVAIISANQLKPTRLEIIARNDIAFSARALVITVSLNAPTPYIFHLGHSTLYLSRTL